MSAVSSALNEALHGDLVAVFYEQYQVVLDAIERFDNWAQLRQDNRSLRIKNR